MASMFPILFGAPSFGNEERDQWVRVLQLFLADPFAPHAVNVGGTTQVSYGWTVPAGAVVGGGGGGIIDIDTGTSGSLPWSRITGVPEFFYLNGYGLRELNPYSSYTILPPGEPVVVSDRPGVLNIFIEPTGLAFGIFNLVEGGAVEVAQDSPNFYTGFTTIEANPGTINVYEQSGGSEWLVVNNTTDLIRAYFCITSMGEQRVPGRRYTEFFTADGSTSTFIVAHPSILRDVLVSVNGVTATRGSSYTLSPDFDGVEFYSPPSPGDSVSITYDGSS